jgi:hypothetical protein
MDAIDLTEEDQPAEGADVEALEVQLVSVEAELQEVMHFAQLSCSATPHKAWAHARHICCPAIHLLQQ